MALGEVVVPYLDSPNDFAWRSSLAASRDRMQFALDGLDTSPMREDRRPNNRDILQNNIAFMDECLKTNAISVDALQGFAKKQSPPNLNLSQALWRSFLYIFNVDFGSYSVICWFGRMGSDREDDWMRGEDFLGWLSAIAGMSAEQRRDALLALMRADGGSAATSEDLAGASPRKGGKRGRREDALERRASSGSNAGVAPTAAGGRSSPGAGRTLWRAIAARAAGAPSTP